MDKLFRFSDYDVFAYLASGLAALVIVDLAFATPARLSLNARPLGG
jgi:hypothetical protein